MASISAKLACAALLCLAAALTGCAGGPAKAPEPTAAPSETSTPAPASDTATSTPVPSSDAATTAPAETEKPPAQSSLDFGKGAHVKLPENMTVNSLKDELVDFTSTTPTTMDTYWFKDPDGSLRVALAHVHSDMQLYADPGAKETRDAVLECLKRSVFPTLTNVLSDVVFTPPFADAEIVEGTYKTDAGEFPMLEIQTQDAYRLRAVIADNEVIVLLGFSEAEKQPVMDFLDSLRIDG